MQQRARSIQLEAQYRVVHTISGRSVSPRHRQLGLSGRLHSRFPSACHLVQCSRSRMLRVRQRRGNCLQVATRQGVTGSACVDVFVWFCTKNLG